jgi:hypothetical protein
VALPLSPAFLVNDPDHAPFGAPWLRGITPARVAVFAAVCFFVAFPAVRSDVLSGEYGKAMWLLWDRSARGFACATPMFILVIKMESWTAAAPTRVRLGALVLAVVAGAAIYTALRTGLRFFHGTVVDPAVFWETMVAYFARSIIIGALLTAILYFAARERDAARQLHRARMSRAEIDSQLVESRLKLLQAQIEPHFLFNSLASVKRLYESDKGKGRALLGNLAAYLRAAALGVRRREVPLGEEIALAKTFLEIFRVRMGSRLLVRIDVPAEHEGALVPPMTIGTLIENSIKHGLAPRAAGGRLDITAHRDEESLVIAVADDGVGFRGQSGRGVGLANIRARLETLFGPNGSLELAANPDGGVTATLRLPYRRASS